MVPILWVEFVVGMAETLGRDVDPAYPEETLAHRCRTELCAGPGAGMSGSCIFTTCACDAGYQPGVVLDPFVESGTTMKVALALGRSAIGIELNPDYLPLIRQRIPQLSDQDIVDVKEGQSRQGRPTIGHDYLRQAAYICVGYDESPESDQRDGKTDSEHHSRRDGQENLLQARGAKASAGGRSY